MTGSADLFDHDGRSPRASINYVTVHDGFTLADLVSYERKHNEANGEDNRDGSDENHSTNCGVEGPTDDPDILALRRQLRRNLLASLMLAQGVPLLLAGDEVGNSQNGNNNAYCQDNPVGWVDWSALGLRRRGYDRAARATSPSCAGAFRSCARGGGSQGRRPDGSFGVLWLTPHATEMTEQDWNFPEGRFLSYVLGPVEPEERAALHRAQRRARDDRIHASDARANTAAGRCCSTPRPSRASARNSHPARDCRRWPGRFWHFRVQHDGKRALWRRVARRRGHFPSLGSGGASASI